MPELSWRIVLVEDEKPSQHSLSWRRLALSCGEELGNYRSDAQTTRGSAYIKERIDNNLKGAIFAS